MVLLFNFLVRFGALVSAAQIDRAEDREHCACTTQSAKYAALGTRRSARQNKAEYEDSAGVFTAVR